MPLSMSRTAREVLNELRWREPPRLADAVLWYRDRQQAGGYRVIRGTEILDLESRYFQIAKGRLPYYKIERIECAGEIVFDRSRRSG